MSEQLESLCPSNAADCSGLISAGIDIDKLNIGEPFSIPQHILLSAPSIAGISQIVQELGRECAARGLTLSEWIDQPTGDHMFKVETKEVLTLAKLMSCRSMLNGDARLS